MRKNKTKTITTTANTHLRPPTGTHTGHSFGCTIHHNIVTMLCLRQPPTIWVCSRKPLTKIVAAHPKQTASANWCRSQCSPGVESLSGVCDRLECGDFQCSFHAVFHFLLTFFASVPLIMFDLSVPLLFYVNGYRPLLTVCICVFCSFFWREFFANILLQGMLVSRMSPSKCRTNPQCTIVHR